MKFKKISWKNKVLYAHQDGTVHQPKTNAWLSSVNNVWFQAQFRIISIFTGYYLEAVVSNYLAV